MLLAFPALAGAGEWSAEVGLEATFFTASSRVQTQHDDSASLSGQAEYYTDWDDGRQRFVFVPFARVDGHDDERTHADIRELYWRRSFDTWDLYAGVRKVFWGVTESRHLVDVVNQTDLVEDLDGEDKLGQPMLSADFIRDWGTVSLFVLPYFRERTFPGPDGRLRTIPAVDTDRARYESGAGRRHVDLALRWSHYIGAFDIGVAHFSGTARDPRLEPATETDDAIVLAPFYDQVERTSLDLQATTGAWLWKLELLSERDSVGRHTALVGGFEYTFYGVAGSGADLGALVEYLGDDRGERAGTAFQDDLFLGARIGFNDIQGSEILAGVVTDLDGGGNFFNLEASRRLGKDWTLDMEIRVVAQAATDNRLASLARDDHARLVVTRHF